MLLIAPAGIIHTVDTVDNYFFSFIAIVASIMIAEVCGSIELKLRFGFACHHNSVSYREEHSERTNGLMPSTFVYSLYKPMLVASMHSSSLAVSSCYLVALAISCCFLRLLL